MRRSNGDKRKARHNNSSAEPAPSGWSGSAVGDDGIARDEAAAGSAKSAPRMPLSERSAGPRSSAFTSATARARYSWLVSIGFEAAGWLVGLALARIALLRDFRARCIVFKPR